MQKDNIFAPKRYTVGFLHTDSLIVLDMKPLYSNATRIAFCEKSNLFAALSILGDSGDSWSVWNRGITNTI